MKKHFVTFLSPGTFVAEETTKEIDSWDVNKAIEMSKGIVERYNAIPYGFFFTTRERGESDFDSKETKRSNLYYLGGEILTLEQVKSRYPDKDILISNMEINHYEKIVVNTNSWMCVRPLEKDDVILKVDFPKK